MPVPEVLQQEAPCIESACPGLLDAHRAGQSRLRDGGGIVSDGDWFSPKAPDVLLGLRQQWLLRVDEMDLVGRLRAQVCDSLETPLLNEERDWSAS